MTDSQKFVVERINQFATETVKPLTDEYYETDSIVTVELGNRYAKVLVGARIHSFVDMTNGDILKPATFRAPAKHARGSIWSANVGASAVNWFGPLYLR